MSQHQYGVPSQRYDPYAQQQYNSSSSAAAQQPHNAASHDRQYSNHAGHQVQQGRSSTGASHDVVTQSGSGNAAPRVIRVGPYRLGKCWGRDTQMLMYDGTRRAVQDIVEGDQLMGDDNTPRTVQPHSVIAGRGEMYQIQRAKKVLARYTEAESFTCNAAHILVLVSLKRPWIERLRSGKWAVHSLTIEHQSTLR